MPSTSHTASWIMLAFLSLALVLGGQGTASSQETSAPSPAQDEPTATRTIPSRNIALDRGVLFEPVGAAPRQGNAGLFIGVNDFTKDKRLNRLQFAVNDAIEQAYLFVFELKLIPARNCLLLFVDACQERIADRAVGGAPPAGQGMDAAFREAFAKATGQYKLASCSATELSYENPALGDVGHGVFTHALLEALRGGAAVDGQNLVRLSAVEEYVSAYVTKWSADAKLPAQTPFSAGARSSRGLPLAKKADDLATLAASVRKQPPSGGFTAEMRGSLVAVLGQLDLKKEADRELVTATREFVNGKTRAPLFVPPRQGVGRFPRHFFLAIVFTKAAIVA